MKLTRLGAVVVLAASVTACGTQTVGGGTQAAQHSAPAPARSGGGDAGGNTGPAGTVTAPQSGAGSAVAGTASAAPPVTVQATGPPTNPGLPSPRPTKLTGPVTLTAANTGAVVYLHTGQQVTVVLAPGFEQWHLPAASGTAVRLVSASGGFPGKQPARAVFLAVAPGTALLSSTSDAACLHAHPRCMIPQQLWRATVIVSG